MVIPAAPATADEQVYPELEIITEHEDGDVVAGRSYTFNYEIRNDTGKNLTVPRDAFVHIAYAYDPARDPGYGPQISGCALNGGGYAELDQRLQYYVIELPTTIPPGLVAECEISYKPTTLDIAQGGLWTMMAYHPSDEWEDWAYWWTYGLTAEGVSPDPEISGDGRAGYRLKTTDGFWGPIVPPYVDDFAYYWYRDGEEIPRARNSTYIPTAADVGRQLTSWACSPYLGLCRESDPMMIEEPGPVVLTDVSDDTESRYFSEFAEEITWLAETGVTTGYSNGDGTSKYRPFGKVTRDAMAAFLYRYDGSPEVTEPELTPFVDVTPTNSDFYDEITWIRNERISGGWLAGPGREYRPFNSITRDAMAAFLYRYAGEPDVEAPAVSPFEDVTPTSTEFYKEITWLAETGITTGWDTDEGKEFRPFAPITRDAMAAFLYRYDDQFGTPVPEPSGSPEARMGARSALTEPEHRASVGALVGSCVDATGCDRAPGDRSALAGE